MKYILDTNLYVEASRSAVRREEFRTMFFPLLPLVTRNRADFVLIRSHTAFALRVLD